MILRDDEIALVERIKKPVPKFSLIDGMYVERGTKKDWDELHELHYKASTIPAGARFWRCMSKDGDLVGIVVTSSVSLMLAARHRVFPKLKPGNDTKTTNVHRGKWLNKNIRRVARVVTDTMYRGVGVSYRMINLVCRMEGLRFMEIQSSMSKFNPFDAKAGFKHAHLANSANYAKGLKFFRRYFECHPADHERVMQELTLMPPLMRESVETEIRDFYYRHSAREKTGSNLNAGQSKVNSMPIGNVVRELQQLIFAAPVYGIFTNPDCNRKLPERLLISVFDNQPPLEQLNLEKL
ncbi:conserved hypothetical protein [Vibrio coralliirubri]|uniref:hypothetical protein n=1 Tax=Vibrio coralliirubri TaxID=1516159 RepID=UPI000634C5F7|nr:hypothetical protein [Vibrio coralliirubri]CDT52778.1 conserved hypothetical protein [Vibrio coralliirubri]